VDNRADNVTYAYYAYTKEKNSVLAQNKDKKK